MTEPFTSNIGLTVPNTGDLVGTWGSAALNPNFLALDGFQGGFVTIGLTNSPVTLSVPAGFTASETSGPTQAQNGLIRFTGTLSGNCVITFPLPGYYIVENKCTVGSYYVRLVSAGAGNAIGAPPGKKCHVFNDGTNMDYVNMPDPGQRYDLYGVTAMPAWMTACTVLPYLLRDGTSYTTSAYPGLFQTIGYAFGGSGGNFNVPDDRNRISLPIDTNTNGGYTNRVTSAGSGINGQTLGAAADAQSVTLTTAQMPSHNHTDSGHTHSYSAGNSQETNITYGGGGPPCSTPPTGLTTGSGVANIQNTGGGGAHSNVQPTIVSVLGLIKT